MKKKVLFVAGGVLLVIIGVLLLLKHDADQKAKAFNSELDTVRTQYKEQLPKLNLGTIITGEGEQVDTDTPEKAKNQGAACSAAQSLSDTLKAQKAKLDSSPGGFMSQSYEKAKDASQNLDPAIDKLQSYYDMCHYFVLDTERDGKIKGVRDSDEYRSLLVFENCSSVTGCLPQDLTKMVTVQTKINDLYKEYLAKYKALKCPLTGNGAKEMCDSQIAFQESLVADSEAYLAAFKAGNLNQYRQAVANRKVNTAFPNLNAITQKYAPDAKNVNGYMGSLFAQQEKELAATSF